MEIKDQNEKIAFTLAEVLITLAIIGVVAAMTIPTLIKDYQNAQAVAALKKAYSQFNQALVQLTNDAGCNGDLKCTGLFSAPNVNIQAFGDEISKYLKSLQVCGMAVGQGCWAKTMNTDIDGTGTNYTYDSAATLYKFISADGASFLLGTFKADCNTPSSWSNGVTGNMAQICGRLYVDVNGPAKGPNYYGRDIFLFWITNGKGALLYPASGADDHYNNGNYWWNYWAPPCCTSGAAGRMDGSYCAGRIMEENWEMNY